jgi:hypothetical protein
MGLLDDAIREHLDLKRRRGGDPTEIERAEDEALGPVRRDPFEQGPDDFESAAAPGDGMRAFDHEDEAYDGGDAYEEYGAEEEWEQDFEDGRPEPGAPHIAAGETPEPREGDLGDPTRLMDHEALDEPEATHTETTASTPPYQTEGGAGDETMQYDVEEALASESEHTESAPDWAEPSDEWAEGSDEWGEHPHEPAAPPLADEGSPLESPPAERPYADHAEPHAPESPLEPEEPPHHSESAAAEPGVEPESPGQDVHGHRPEPGAPEAKPGEDVLEETPEFLQDTPDHDRLWFEQRPPKDFDFDG